MVTRAVHRAGLRVSVNGARSTLRSSRRPLSKRSGPGNLNGDLALLFVAGDNRMRWEYLTIVLVFLTLLHMDGTGPPGVGSRAVYPLQDIQTGFSKVFSRYSPGYAPEAPFTGPADTSAIQDSVCDVLILP